MEQFRAYLQKTRGASYPVHAHPIQQKAAYEKDMYFKMMCLVLEYNSEMNKEQTILLERLILGTNARHTIGEYIRQSYEIDNKLYKTFVEEVLIDEIKYAFIADVLVFTQISKLGDETIQFITELVECLKIDETQLVYLLKLAKAILEQDMEIYLDETTRFAPIEYTDVLCYLIQKGEVLATVEDDTVVFESDNLVSMDFSTYIKNGKCEFSNKKLVRFFGLYINLGDMQLSFTDVDQIEFVNCVFIGGEHNVVMAKCKNISIVDCVFKEYKTHVVYCQNRTGQVVIKDTKIRDFDFDGKTSQEVGVAIYGYNVEGLTIDNCQFNNISVRSNKEYGNSIISNCKASVTNSKFENCWHYHSNNTRDEGTSGSVLFSKLSENVNNTVVDSAKLEY
ncbi:MAG: hypothetical protein ATN35_11370 [Epulopiscium sp. Nele67-Bin004]|nr:MAG: hypothetical protein ATN35_11370 [Epulopiscium sp. Nele67-Bin004]